MSLDRIRPQRLDGNETFAPSDRSNGLRVADFWSWAYSDLLSNTTRGVLAEFLVARGLGIREGARVEWDGVDLRTREGVGIEVKSAAYLQTWNQEKLSSIQFDIGPRTGWNATTNTTDPEVRRRADVYVFCLLDHQDKQTVDPMNLTQWRFFVLATSVLDARIGEQKKISLGPLLRLNPIEAEHDKLRTAVMTALRPR